MLKRLEIFIKTMKILLQNIVLLYKNNKKKIKNADTCNFKALDVLQNMRYFTINIASKTSMVLCLLKILHCFNTASTCCVAHHFVPTLRPTLQAIESVV